MRKGHRNGGFNGTVFEKWWYSFGGVEWGLWWILGFCCGRTRLEVRLKCWGQWIAAPRKGSAEKRDSPLAQTSEEIGQAKVKGPICTNVRGQSGDPGGEGSEARKGEIQNLGLCLQSESTSCTLSMPAFLPSPYSHGRAEQGSDSHFIVEKLRSREVRAMPPKLHAGSVAKPLDLQHPSSGGGGIVTHKWHTHAHMCLSLECGLMRGQEVVRHASLVHSDNAMHT